MAPTRREPAPLEVLPDAARAAPELPLAPAPAAEEELSLRDYLEVVAANRWLIAGAAALALLLGGAYALLAAPVYRSDVLLQVEEKNGGLGFEALFAEASPAETEIEILRSRALVGAVVDELRLDLVAEPRRFPLFGAAVARWHEGDGVRPPVLGLDGFGWGGERIALARLEVPPPLLERPLTLVAGEGGRFTLLDDEGRRLAEGVVGRAVSGGGVELFVAELRARPGTRFRLERRLREEAVAGLQEELSLAEKGRKTGILRIALEGTDRERTAATLDALSRQYLRQNVERRSAEAAKTLEFLGEQLPALRATLESAEAELERYRSRSGAVDVTLATEAAIGQAVEVEKALSELRLQHAELRQRFTGGHPALAALRDKIARMEGERARLEQRMKGLPEEELESARRLRDVKVANELYVTLLNRSQELKIVKEGTIGNVRILDAAMLPPRPVAPRRAVVLALSLLGGLGLGLGLAFARRSLDQGVGDPEAIERATGIGVHASIPEGEGTAEAERRALRERRAVPVLAASDPHGLAAEALRSLRTGLQFLLFEAKSPVVTIAGPAPRVGKSFVTINLAHLLGESGKRVLVVDTDLRRGTLHRYLGVERVPGLSDVLAGRAGLDEALRETRSPNVRFLATGTIPPNPAEQLASERFQRLLGDLAARCDVVLVDTPPILAVTDAALVARHAAVNLMVLRWGTHPLREILAAVRGLAAGGARVHGFVLNGVRLGGAFGRASSYHYQYRYASREDDAE